MEGDWTHTISWWGDLSKFEYASGHIAFICFLPWLQYALFSTNWQPKVSKMLLGKFALGRTKQKKYWHSDMERMLQSRITVFSTVFQRNNYMNFACLLIICNYIWYFYALVQSKKLHAALVIFYRF